MANVRLRLSLAEIFGKKDYNKVIVIAGGLSGNEPGFAGFVGSGMLTAAICSDAFEPLADISILKSLRSLLRCKESASGSKGCLIILQGNKDNNQNFRYAKIKAEGLMVEMLFVEDDCSSFPHSEEGCKGLAGAVLLYKIAGAAAEKGKSLADVLQLSVDAARNIGTVGVASSPAAGRIYYGIGIRAGVVRDREFEGSTKVISQCVSHILSKIHPRSDHKSLEPWGFVVMVNGFSVTAENILSAIAEKAASKLRQLIINDLVPIERLEGIFMTSLTMSGYSVTIMKLTRETLQLLKDPSSAPYWPCSDKLEYLNDFLSIKPLVSLQVPVTVMNKDRLRESFESYDVTLRSVIHSDDDTHYIDIMWIFHSKKIYLPSHILISLIKGLLDLILHVDENYERPVLINCGFEKQEKNIQSYCLDLSNIIGGIVPNINPVKYPAEVQKFFEGLSVCHNSRQLSYLRSHIFLYTTLQRVQLIYNIFLKDKGWKDKVSYSLFSTPPAFKAKLVEGTVYV